jgi:hypothetical protein
MPITAFNNFTDGLDLTQRSREHFITNTSLDDDSLWVPYADGVWFRLVALTSRLEDSASF